MSAYTPNPQQDEIVRAPLDIPLKVIAGAGTGKTETLTQRFLHLVQHFPIAPEAILAITFTEKAASEMMARITGALARNNQSGGRRLAISTFHGFANSLLREYAEHSGVAPDAPVLSTVQQKSILNRIFNDALAGRVDEDGLRAEELARLDVARLDTIRGLAGAVITRAKGNRWTPDEFAHIAEQREEIFFSALPDEALASATGSRAGELTASVHHALYAAGFPCKAWHEELFKQKPETEVRRCFYANLRLKASPINQGFGQDFRSQREAAAMVLKTLVALFRQYNARLAELGALDFDDIILKAADLVEGVPEVAERCRERYQYVLVDEFQDTSPAQMDLIRAVTTQADCPPDCLRKCFRTNRRPVNITIVGDKKQAIYGFRNARRENLDELLPCETPDVRKHLSTNYRSANAILELANVIGLRVEPTDETLGESRGLEGSVHVPALFEEGNARRNKRDEATYIAERIQQLVDPEAVARASYRDIGVLIRNGSQFVALRKAFRARNIPYVCAGGVGLFEEPAAKDVLAWMRAVAHPSDDASLYRILSRLAVPLTDAGMLAVRCPPDPAGDGRPAPTPLSAVLQPDASDARLSDTANRLRDARGASQSMGLRSFLEDIPRVTGLSEVWSDDEKDVWPQICAALLKAADDVERVTPAATLDDLLDLVEIYQSDESSWPGTPPVESDAVRVMTVHAAKGLEFPYVFVPSIKSGRRGDSGWLWDDEWGLLPSFNDGPSIKSIVAKWLRTKKDEQENEEDRCWYVAVTRARDELVVTGTKSGNAKDDAKILEKALPPDLLGRDADDFHPADWATVVTIRKRSDRIAGVAPVAPVRSPAAIQTASFSALGTFQFCPVAAYIQRVWALPPFLEDRRNGTGAKRKGDLLHLCAARYYRGDTAGLPDAVFAPGDDGSVRDGVTRLWAEFVESECAVWKPEGIERAIGIRLNTPTGPLDVSGYADLVLPGDDGLVLADFKTSDSDAPRNPAKYAPQLCLYAMALRAEGLEVSGTGIVVLMDRRGLRVERVTLPQHETAVLVGFAKYATMFAQGRMPDAPDNPPCSECRNREVCPKRRE